MDAVLRQIVDLIPVALAGAVPALITYASLVNRQKKNKADAQEIVNAQFLEARAEINRVFNLLEDEKKLNRDTRAAYEVERTQLNAKIKENSDKLAIVEEALAKTDNLYKQVSLERDNAQKEHDNTKLELTNTRHQLEDKIAGIQAVLDTVKGDYDLMVKRYDDAKAERAQIEKAFAERVSKLETDLATTENELKQVREQLQRVETLLTKTEAERDGLQRKNQQLEAEQTNLKQRVSELETERDGLQRQVNELRTELDALRTSGSVPPDNLDDTKPFPDTDLPIGE